VGLLGMVLGLTVMVGGALLVLDDEDYRVALVWAADKFLDASLQIKGAFALHLAREASLSAGEVSLRANDGSYTLGIGEFQTRVRLDSLVSGILWVRQLTLGDVHLEVQERANDDGINFSGISFPTFVIEEARLHNLYFVYRESDPDKSHTLALLELIVDDVNNSGPLGIQGDGLIEDRHFNINGRLDSLVQLIQAEQPYSVHLDITSGTLESHLEGLITRPLEGVGLDLSLTLTDPELSKTLGLWNDRAPALGAVSAQMRLRGDYDRPRLEQISARLRRPGELDLSVTGEIEDLLTMEQLELRVSGQSSNPAVTSWLLFDQHNKLKTLAAEGTVRARGGQYRVEDLKAKATTRSGIEIDVSGTADIHKTLKKRPAQLTGLRLALDSPTTRAMTSMTSQGGDAIPELGRVKVTARLVPYLDGISLDGLSLDIGGPGQLRTTARGSIDVIPFYGMEKSSGFNLMLDARAEKSTYLNNYLKLKLPELGAVHAQARVRGGMSSVSIESLKLYTGSPAQPTLRANGTIRTEFRRRSTTMDIGFDVATAGLIAAFYEKPPSADLGRLEGSVTASDVDGTWGLDKFTMVSDQTGLFRFKASGALGDLVNRDQGQVRTMLEIDDVPALGKTLGVNLSGFSPYRGQGHLRIDKGYLDYEASNTVGATTSATRVTGSLAGDKPRLTGTLDIPVIHLGDLGLGKRADHGKTAGVSAEPAGKKFLFSRRALDLKPLRALDLDLAVTVHAVAGTEFSFERLDARINLTNGVLRASPVKLEFESGPSTLDLEINARQRPVISLKVTGNDLMLGPVLAQIQNEVPVEGYVNLQIDVSAGGDSPHALLSSLDGKISFGLENARVPRKYVEYLAVDVFGWVVSATTRRDPYANLDCVMGAFDINDGVATSNLLAADGPTLALTGTAVLDLGDETLDMTLLPKQKQHLFSGLAPVHIKGPIRDPAITALPVKSAVTSLGSLVLMPAMPMVAIPAILGEKLWASLDDHDKQGGGCVRLAKKIAAEKVKEQKR